NLPTVQEIMVSIYENASPLELYANKDRRNYTKTIEDNIARGLVPDITITNLKHGIKFLIIEHRKSRSLNDKKKELEDTLKSCTLLHNIIRRAHDNLTLRNIEDFKVFGAVTSALEMKIYMLNIAAKELYIFQEIDNCILPSHFQEYNPDILRKTIITLIKLR
ncbi:4499_t:CDS:2, partial [Scutellospora calospora]